ncbi:hypothetical protein Metbo_2356 [Methanobacterium lacus]|uniref:Glycosyltransferase RgtA/B/C/D-like domain-containing protein n=2 Tax=Methanobacterium lacus (strain AL-21) TaxID=877455 RepID=F0T662_METLA|nr:hypothetical protein Metbo_2356 [Methanobacterium lacus]
MKNLGLKKLFKTKYDIYFSLILLFYIVTVSFLFKYYMYQINNDGIVYINISRQILEGHFYESISDYWGPLISWLMLPFLYFLKSPLMGLYSAKLTSIVIGLVTLFGIRRLSYRFEMEEWLRTLIILTTVPVITYFVMSFITPDLLMVCVLTYYLAAVYDPNYSKTVLNGIFCGFLGALAYFTKSYGFTFFIASFLIFNLIHYLTEMDKTAVIKNLAAGLLVFLLISSVWICFISYKDGKITYGSSGDFNYALVGPNSMGFAEYSEGLHNPDQVNTNYLPKEWSPFSSWANFQHQLNLIWKGAQKTGTILNYFSILSFLIIIIYILLLIVPPRNVSKIDLVYPLITMFILTAGYIIVVVEERYIWLIYLLLILMGGYLLNKLFNLDLFNSLKWNYLLKLVCVVGFICLMTLMPVNYLIGNLNTGKDSYALANTLNGYGVHGNVATNDKLTEMNYLQYYMGTDLYGQSQRNISSKNLQNDLNLLGINYYFVWGNSNQNSYMGSYTQVANLTSYNLVIYKIN